MAEVEVIKAVDGPILRKRDYEGNPLVITRQRVAAYVRVSTDDDEQLESFQSQKKYYQEKISENRDWVMVGIYADEAITGTKVDKREQFQRMIQDCMDNKIVCPPSKNRHKIALKNGMNLNNSFIFVKTYAFIPRFT